MPLEKRDPRSGAKIFVPTHFEKATIQQQRDLKKSLAEVEAMKAELKELIDKFKQD
jgi:hypothetical protein